MLTENDFVPIPLFKRIFDIIASGILLLFLFPFVLVVFLMTAIERIFFPASRGPFFYCEKRISAGKEFKFCKIRTCKMSAFKEALERAGFIETIAIESDKKNLTNVGKILKKIYLDEFPQLWSVFIGDMTLVGPRPSNLKDYQTQIQNNIFTKKAMKTGITGPLQSFKGSERWGTIDGAVVDEEYIEFCRKNSSLKIFFLDLKIILKTIKIIFEHKGL